MTPYMPFLCNAIGFSWLGFSAVFAARLNMSRWHLAQVTMANGIFLYALGLAFVGRDLFVGVIVVAAGMTIAAILCERVSLPVSILIAASSFAAYLYGTME